MNLIIRFFQENTEPLAFICGVFLMMFAFVCAMAMGLKNAGVKRTNKLFGERGVRKSMTDALERKGKK